MFTSRFSEARHIYIFGEKVVDFSAFPWRPPTTEMREPLIEFCNEWMGEHRFPKIHVTKDSDGDINLNAEFQMVLSGGMTDFQLKENFRFMLVGMNGFFEAVIEAFPELGDPDDE